MSYTSAYQNGFLMTQAGKEQAEAVIYAEKPDAQLIELVLAGDEAAFEQLFDRYKRLVASIAARFLRQPEQIDEIIQISFAKAYFELKNFRGGHDFSLAGWLARIATNAALDALKAERRKREDLVCELSEFKSDSLLSEIGRGDRSVEISLVERDLAEKLLAHLTAEDRAVLQMLDAEEMSVGEVAALTGWTKSKVKIRAYRARKALRKIVRKFL